MREDWSSPQLTKDAEAEECGVIYPQNDGTLSALGAQSQGGAIEGRGWVLPRMSPASVSGTEDPKPLLPHVALI